MTLAYRTPSPVPPEPIAEHRGPREVCPICGASRTDYWACFGASLLARIFGGCSRRGPHLHQRCRTCGGLWTCGPKEDS